MRKNRRRNGAEFDPDQMLTASEAVYFSKTMRNFLYRCPVVGLNVQGSIKREKPPDVGKDHHIVNCLACGGIHIVNPVTGKLLRDESEKP